MPTPSQIIQPYDFGDKFSKKTCLWLINLPPLFATGMERDFSPYCPSNTSNFTKGHQGSLGVAHSQKDRSKTFKGIASAMAEQWGDFIKDKEAFL